MEVIPLNKIYNSEVDYMKLLFENNFISIYELDAIHLGENPNGMNIDKECAIKSLPSFADQPLYCVIDNKFDPLDSKNNDFMEHFREDYPERITRDRILPFGCVPESAIPDAKFIDRDGKTYLRINVVVWKNLLPHVSDILQRRDGNVRVSVEFVIKEADQDSETGIINVHEFQITAITALGEKFKEIMEGARLKTIKFSFNDYIKDSSTNYFSFSSQKSYEVPDEVLKKIKDGVSMREEFGRGGNKKLYNCVKSISETGIMYEDQSNIVNSYFSELTDIPTFSNPPTNKYILYNMFGGDSGSEWLNSVVCNGKPDTINKGGGSTLDKIEIDNSKESAVSGSSWSNPGRSLYDPILEASNSESLVNEAYLVVEDGYKDAPSEKLKYPHHKIKDGKLVVDVSGVKAAFQRASQMGIVEGKVKAHLEKHYKELGLDTDKFAFKDGEEDMDFEKKCAELEEKFAALEKEKNDMATEKEAAVKAKEDSEQKMCDLQTSFDSLNAELGGVKEKLAKYEKEEVVKNNMAMLDKFAKCFSEEEYNAFKQFAEDHSNEEMNSKMSEKFAKMAESYCSNDTKEKKFSFSVNPFYDPNKVDHKTDKDDLSKIINKYNVKV